MIETTEIERIATISPESFLDQYKKQQVPVVIRQLTKQWPARTKWSIDYLSKIAGDHIVPLYNSSPSKDNSHQHAPTIKMRLKEYLELLAQGENNLRLFFYNILSEIPALSNDFIYPDIGLKFFKKLPVLFMGGKGAKVQMHFDIDMADIMLCHFGGKKQVMLFPPDQTKYMYHVPFSFSSLHSVNFECPDYQKYPALNYLKGYHTELNHGDVLYIPPGYWHFIRYDEISFSMALRAFPRDLNNTLKLLRNILIIRSIEGLMRKLFGLKWIERNERQAIINTHQNIPDKS